ncbi:MAG: hypothetical protein NXH90_04290 [Flavobacteriaceae bacterium]|nr:hypothetical protein [Flavobacteriaceae bacterium]
MSDNIVKNKLYKPIESLAINREDLLRFLQTLQERANSACDMECNHVDSLVPLDNLEKIKENLKGCSTLKLTVVGSDGEELFGTIDEVFDSVSFPEHIESLYVNSGLLYESQFNYYPRNRFNVLLDFSRPKVFDFSFLPSDKTPNNSNFSVEGYDNTWVNGVFNEMDNFFDRRSSRFSGIHKNSIYDIIVWSLGIPMGFWSCFKLGSFISGVFTSNFMENAFYVYVFFLSLFILRILFHYFRWLYPKIQYKSTKDISTIHRGFFYIITTGIISAFLYDILGLLF